MSRKISIIGAGSWGTALGKTIAEKHEDVMQWAFEPEVASSINAQHRNPLFLSEFELPPNLKATDDLQTALKDRDIVFSVVPAQALRGVWTKAAAYLHPDAILVSCTKGIEEHSGKLVSEILAECLPRHPSHLCVYLSGPSFAKEVAQHMPTALTIAGTDQEIAHTVQQLLRTETLMTFTHRDVTGFEIAGAVKNVLAIATGVGDGLGYGKNTRAALITRGLYEMTKIGLAKGAEAYTFMGLAGIGDLVLTATDEQSRNYTVGKRLGHGEKIGDIIASMKMVAEGYKTSVALHALIKEHRVSAPICAMVYRMLHENLDPKIAVHELCSTALTEELRSVHR
jgi:glycerol-3-phosphate dehydrogenase (NAD(P)+)